MLDEFKNKLTAELHEAIEDLLDGVEDMEVRYMFRGYISEHMTYQMAQAAAAIMIACSDAQEYQKEQGC